MNRRLIAASGGCIGGDRPTDHLPDRGTAVVEAYVVTDRTVFARLGLAVGEAAVAVPLDVLTMTAGEVA